ncbi:LysR family transcriptional regulator [Phyllobacterium brassicacearum]|uniref:LysR family transcriptional regulator n=1 Tax=Phyllobacterium brassicacearum TaxID=314235 RepID=A0A2P7BV60_9HYPH|nr:LysR substrate-binding domain-containing protein [Phyllobacterium brassicacearum]PSH70351.1 LysR family transcriptional regulator [Phyllobacterium brassicacearum]TDQ28063.1 DNA-binding transcriptional LysR family regulator [Phyllobacterium brassicacearum]
MTSSRPRLPSTTALQVLIAIAERGSTSAAAESTSLSQSAVSKQLLALEGLIGSPAFQRTARGMLPTKAGLIYIEHARTALKAMEDASLQVARLRPDPHVLRLQVLPIFGDRWLLPRFAGFAEKHPEIDVQFTTFVSSTQTEEPDGIFRFVRGPLTGEDSVYLFGRDVVIVSAASYWDKIGMPESIEHLATGVMLEHPQTMLHWQDFAFANGCPDLMPRHTIRFGYYTMVIRAALAGQGMALIPRGLILDDLQLKRLVNPHGYSYRSDWGYWFTTPQDVSGAYSMKMFKNWLMDEAQAMLSDRSAL